MPKEDLLWLNQGINHRINIFNWLITTCSTCDPQWSQHWLLLRIVCTLSTQMPRFKGIGLWLVLGELFLVWIKDFVFYTHRKQFESEVFGLNMTEQPQPGRHKLPTRERLIRHLDEPTIESPFIHCSDIKEKSFPLPATVCWSWVLQFAFELPLMVKGIMAFIPQPLCSAYSKTGWCPLYVDSLQPEEHFLKLPLFALRVSDFFLISTKKGREEKVIHIKVCIMRI